MLKFIYILILLVFCNHLSSQDSDTLFFNSAVRHFKSKDYSKARELATKSLEINPNLGEAYILIGHIYASSANECYDDNYFRGIVYCLAVDMFEKAILADSLLAKRVQGLIQTYSKYFPSPESIPFLAPLEGDKYKIGCWINKETIVRYSD